MSEKAAKAAAPASKGPTIKEIPNIIINPKTHRKYVKGKLLGKGGFARCYELIDAVTKEVYAGKIVSKQLLTKKHQKDKMAQEICIHRSLDHKHIVKFVSYFEDTDNVYILLELCARRSLMEMHKRRRAITEPETRYFMQQIIFACGYLHSNKIIHRDLKLGNLFMNDDMQIKLGDFGLATRVDHDGERKKTLCGTPNYIAPEMLNKNGHSYEVDVWALGCIMYTLLVGKPPFETDSLRDTYNRIKKNEYEITAKISPPAEFLIRKLLQHDPRLRPSVQEILTFDFFTSGYVLSGLPTSCLTVAPNFSRNSPVAAALAKRPLVDSTNRERVASPLALANRKDQNSRALKSVPENRILKNADVALNAEVGLTEEKSATPDNLLLMIQRELHQLIRSKPHEKPVINQEEAEDPASTPFFWISKWVDYSDKYGLGYQLCDNSVGVYFNDYTKLILNENGESLQYVSNEGSEAFYDMKSFPKDLLNKKITLLNYFRNYMNEHLLKAGSNVKRRDADDLARLPYLLHWFRTRSAIVLFLNCGILQLNFFDDHTKLIICPLMAAVTYIDENRDFHTYKFEDLQKYGCSMQLYCRLKYAHGISERLYLRASGSRPSTLPSSGAGTLAQRMTPASHTAAGLAGAAAAALPSSRDRGAR